MRKVLLLAILIVLAVGVQADELEFTGFVDAAYSYNPADTIPGEFGVDQAELNIMHQASEQAVMRVDLEWVKDGESFLAQVEQAFMTYTCEGGWDFTFGKFNAPIGFELLDPNDMYQYSHALVFDYGLPTNLTGASVGRAFDGGLDFVAYVSNGWDANAMAGDNVTGGGRVGFARECLSGGLSAIAGKERRELFDDLGAPLGMQSFTRTVFDIDLCVTKERWLVGGEFNMGKVTDLHPEGDVDMEWMGFMAMTHVDLTDRAGFTFRFDYFDDKDGWAFGTVEDEVQKVTALTFCPTFALTDNLGALVELRLDTSDQKAFEDGDGEPTDSNTTLAFEMTYGW